MSHRDLAPYSGLRCLAAAILVLAATVANAFAQMRVELAFRRSLFIRYEPIIATVTIENLSGREIELSDEGNYKWFSFQIESTDGRLVPPYDADYRLSPIRIGAGDAIRRQMNLTPLYPVTEYGVYRVRASIWDRTTGRYYSSATPLNIEITEGRVLWEQIVGVPPGEAGEGGTRTVTLLSHRLPDTTMLYVRIHDRDNGVIYCTHQLGRFVTFGPPDVELDAQNRVHILQTIAPRQYLYSAIGLNGQVLARKQYEATSTPPRLRRNDKGGMSVVGGAFVDPNAPKPETPAVPSIADRPVPLPAGALEKPRYR